MQDAPDCAFSIFIIFSCILEVEILDGWTSQMYLQIHQGGDLEVWFKAAPDEIGVTKYDLALYQCENGCGLIDKKRDEYKGIAHSVSVQSVCPDL